MEVFPRSESVFFDNSLVAEIQQRKRPRRGPIAGGQITFTDGTTAALGPEVLELLRQIPNTVDQGRTVIERLPKKVTSAQAAELLGVSTPTIRKWIASGELPATWEGTHARLETSDVLQHRSKRLHERRKAFAELRKLEEEQFPHQG